MKESKLVTTIINNVGDNNQYKNTSDYMFEILLPTKKELISFAEEYFMLEDKCVKSLEPDIEYCKLLSQQLDVFSDYIINGRNESAINEFISLFENVKNNYGIRLNNVRMLYKKNPDLYHN